MARPQKDGLDYFPHDTDATSDEKIEALRMLYGNDGYAFYFILLERIYRTSNAELEIPDAETKQILSRKIGISTEQFESILATALRVGCFDRRLYEDKKLLTSNGVKKRLKVVVDKRERMRTQYQTKKVSAAEMGEETEQKPDKEKKRKEKKTKVKESKLSYSECVFLKPSEYQKLVDEHGEEFTKRCIAKLDSYIPNKPGKPYTDHYRAILNWVVGRVQEDIAREGGRNSGQAGHGQADAKPKGKYDHLYIPS